MLLPLAFMLLGLWEGQRGSDDWAAFDAERSRLAGVVADLEARVPRDGRIDFRMQFRRNGQTYAGPLALDQARAARDEAGTMTTLMDWRRVLPPIAVVAGGLAAMLSVLVLVAGAGLGWVGQASRETLVRGFSLVRRLLPPVLAAQILLATAGFVAVVIFETGMLVHPGLGGGEIKLLMLAAVAAGAAIVAAGTAVLGLRRALAAFEPDPLPVHGRVVSAADAPGLWRLTQGLAARLGALEPEAVVVGVTGGYFVSSGPAVLTPSGEALTGRILYLPLPYLALMRGDETAAIIAHELAHYAGGDTAYSQRFLPIYAGVARSLDAVAAGHQGALGLLGPSLRLGVFVMERFHLAVRHWSRAREFAADAAGAVVTSADASARALLRSGSLQPSIVATLDAAAAAPDSGPADLVAAALDRAIARGLDDPAVHLETEQAHPTDTHPTTRERVAALGRAIDPSLLAAAGAVPPPHALGQLAAYFADPIGLCRAATDDFLGTVRAQDAAFAAHLETTAAEVGVEEQVLRENSRPGAFVFVAAGGLFGVTALAMLLVGFPGLPPSQAWIVATVALVIAALFAGLGTYRLRQGERVTLILRPGGLAVPGLDRVITWDDIADLDLTTNQTGIVTRLLLPPEAPFPQRAPGGRGIKLDAKRRIVTIALGLPRRMKPQDLADLFGRYQQAAQARRILAERNAGASPAPVPSNPVA
ncbi:MULTISPECIES: M48 family metalloprotease [Methylobacterium]|uniref:Protease HtpX n=1 Tax=Methylobacterium thuringiense TaxID=1003091 RepID=A0ABQ4TKR9_9HYPH|nr:MULTISPECIES: M48 family metalloprotease [Methylobacterium]TXN23950.1 M48 family metalloprotease [Methylobacterium sp. WL9]GJE55218.1 Protease HtpX [Methylobacterium thuringiense]